MDPLTLPRHAFHLALLAKTHVSTLVTIFLEYKYRETKETEHNASIFARKEEREEKKRREIRTSCGSNSRYEITILTRVLQCEILRARNSGPRVSRGTR